MVSQPVLIVGAKGKTGRRVNSILNSRGIETRPVSRSTQPSFDWDKPDGWGDVFEGVKSAYVTFQPDLAIPGADDAIRRVGEIAVDKGLEHVILLSGRGEPGAQRAEEILKASGVPWTIVRASFFYQNFSEHFLYDGVVAGEIVLPVGDIPEPFVDVDDIADVVVTALTERGYKDRLYEVTGPEAITFAQAVEVVSKAIGRPIQYVQIPAEQFEEGLRKEGLPDVEVQLFMELFTQILDGRNSQTASGIQDALGRPPKSFADYVKETAESGAWTPGQ